MKKVYAFVALISLCSLLSALEMAVKVSPDIVFQQGSLSDQIDGPAFGGSIDFDFLNYFYAGPDFSYHYIMKKGSPTSLNDFSFGAEAGAFYSPLSRLTLDVGAAFGIHFTQYNFPGITDAKGDYLSGQEPDVISVMNPYYRISGGVSFRFSPNFSLGAQGGYLCYFYDSKDQILKGPSVGITAKYTFNTKKVSKKVSGDFEQYDSIFPVYLNLYKQNEFAQLTVHNNENAEIKNVQVFFEAGRYTSSQCPGGKSKSIKRGGSAEIPVCADFSEKIFEWSEFGTFPATITITYELLGKKMTAQETVTVSVSNRNSFRWNDSSSIASFISPNTSEILELAKYVSGLARQTNNSNISKSIQTAVWITEGLNAMGITRVNDGITPYKTAHLDSDNPDQIQFPFQTLAYRSADFDEKGILLASLLESAGIDAAYIPLSNDFVVAFSIGDVDSVQTLIKSTDDVVVIDGEAWIPLLVGSIPNGFNAAWTDALKKINAESDTNLEATILRNAWQLYTPAGWSEKISYTKPEPPDLQKRATKEINAYVQNEIQPLVGVYQARIASDPSAKNWNNLGLVYVRLSQYASAKDAFNKAVQKDSIAALCNLGNVALLQKDYKEAERLYNQALKKDPAYKTALKGLEKIKSERGK